VAEAALRREHALPGLELFGRGRSLRPHAAVKQNDNGERFCYILQPVRHRRGIYHV
jgi:hypothetical protein